MTDRLDARPRDRKRLPPGQIATVKWPVLHYSNVPKLDTGRWRFRVWGEVERPLTLGWTEFNALPRRDVLCDMHCVTKWSRYDNLFAGVPVKTLLDLAEVRSTASHVLVHAEPDYTTNLPLADLARDDVLLATHHDGEALSAEHGGPVRLLVPHLYLWKSAKWVRRIQFTISDRPGFWEVRGYHNNGDPWTEERYA